MTNDLRIGNELEDQIHAATDGTGVGTLPASPVPAYTASLDALQSEEQRKVLNVIGSLCQYGLDSVISLPELVVCGDQSSGKSSVLEAFTEIPFHRKEDLCTRFATEIILRRAPMSSITTRIVPDEARHNERPEL